MRLLVLAALSLVTSIAHGQMVIRDGGTSNSPRVIRDVTTGTGFNSGRHAVVVNADYVVLEGWHITSAGDDGIKVYGRNVTLSNCLIENTNDQGIACHRGRNLTVQGCIIRDCGTRTRDHGLYFSGTGHLISDNIFSRCYGYGIHAYQEPTGSSSTGVSDSVVVRNTVVEARTNRWIVWQSGTGGNVIEANTAEAFKVLRLRSSDIVRNNSWQGPIEPDGPTLAERYREIIEREAGNSSDADEDRIQSVIAELQSLLD